jgi:hypothetical protein
MRPSPCAYEVADVLARKFDASPGYVREVVDSLRSISRVIAPRPLAAPLVADTADNLVLARAISARSPFLVTGALG